jgi:hypothetical protein
MDEALAAYGRRRSRYDRLYKKQTGYANIISNLRLAVFVCGLAALVAAYFTRWYILFGAVALASAVVFTCLVLKHDKLIKNRKYTALLVKINEDAAKRIKGEWAGFPDDGAEFSDDGHSYTQDLDIFGKGSLFQWTGCAKTFMGRRCFAGLLSGHHGSAGEIKQRQEAVEALAKKIAWRQRLLAEGMLVPEAGESPEPLIRWAENAQPFYGRGQVKLAVRALPAVTVLLALLAFAFALIPWYVPAAMLLLQYALLKVKARENAAIFELAEKFSGGVLAYSRMLKLFEKCSFGAEGLKSLKKRMTGSDGASAFRQVERLAGIIDSISNRHTPFYFLFNILALWDFQNLISLEKWKRESGVRLKDWLAALGEAEALCSLALIRHDNPGWARPDIVENWNAYEAVDMGHPLLRRENRVDNDMFIRSPAKALLITGSNMSGKSTLLRAAGINLVLAYSGAPVCASSFRVPLLELHTCMRVGDNLEKNISSFYAELVRIKKIVEAVSEGRRVFYLLDEIFKGTNSVDRHSGASVLIRKLSSSDTLGLVSTHDLELCALAEKNDRINNYHFREYYDEKGIHFDYKLRPGASATRNAAYLMKLAGIEVDDQ